MKPSRFFVVFFSLVLTTLVCQGCIAGASTNEKAAEAESPKDKQTLLERQVTAEEAYEKWRAAPDSVKVLDVRTLEEYLFVGHAPMSRNIPLYYQTEEWDAKKERFAMVPNLDFVYQVKQVASVDETILVMCRSGTRSAKAATCSPTPASSMFSISSMVWRVMRFPIPIVFTRANGSGMAGRIQVCPGPTRLTRNVCR